MVHGRSRKDTVSENSLFLLLSYIEDLIDFIYHFIDTKKKRHLNTGIHNACRCGILLEGLGLEPCVQKASHTCVICKVG